MRWILLSFLLISGAWALENDQFTDRDLYEEQLLDFTERLNDKTNQMLDLALDRYNLRFCGSKQKLSDLDIHRMLALQIHNVLARKGGGALPEKEERISPKLSVIYALLKSGKGALQKWLDNPKAHQGYLIFMKDNIYRKFYPPGFNNVHLIKVGGIMIGTDKIDHFIDQGYDYWRISRYGEDDQKAIKYGVDSELGFYGFKAGGVFSFGDLRANWQGYQFYKNLFDIFQVGDNNCIERLSAFDWAAWTDWQFDEFFNSSAYNKKRYRQIRNYMKENASQYCRTYNYYLDRGAYDDFQGKRTNEYLNQDIPVNFSNIFDLAEICR